ncbi:MAG TPA: choice-of-anchor D domain-containing protein [Nocardioides sp.]|nr:choice-of-anchor D domain-containing protein [Nocardioides sp.]
MNQQSRRRWWRRSHGYVPMILSAAALAVALLPVVAVPSAQAVVGTSPDVGAQGFPLWYEDATGTRVDLCLDSPYCTGTSTTLTPGNPLNEAFYASATAPAPDSLGLTGNGVILALGATFDPLTGQPVTFDRVRVDLRGLTPLATYDVLHPYGQLRLTADNQGRVRQTVDTGCLTEPPAPPTCDFAAAQDSPHFGGFLKWDPARAPAAPAGFLGNPLVEHTVVGGPIRDMVTVEGVTDPGFSFTVEDFLVEGRLAQPLTAPNTRAFGVQKVGVASTPRTVTVTNTSGADVSLLAPSVTGTNAAEFTAVPGTTPLVQGCDDGVLLPAGESCAVDVTFTPAGTGPKTAMLGFPSDADQPTAPIPSVRLTGSGALPQASVPAAVAMGKVGLGAAKTTPVTVSNPSNVPLAITDAVLATGGPEFTVNAASCLAAPVPARGSCNVNVTYRPTALGADTASVVITHDAAGSPASVSVTATGADLTAPAITQLAVRPSTFNPTRRSVTVTYGLDGPGQATVKVLRAGRTVRTLGSRQFTAAGTARETWNGRNRAGSVVARGTYRIQVNARDQAGNTSSKTVPVVVTH